MRRWVDHGYDGPSPDVTSLPTLLRPPGQQMQMKAGGIPDNHIGEKQEDDGTWPISEKQFASWMKVFEDAFLRSRNVRINIKEVEQILLLSGLPCEDIVHILRLVHDVRLQPDGLTCGQFLCAMRLAHGRRGKRSRRMKTLPHSLPRELLHDIERVDQSLRFQHPLTSPNILSACRVQPELRTSLTRDPNWITLLSGWQHYYSRGAELPRAVAKQRADAVAKQRVDDAELRPIHEEVNAVAARVRFVHHKADVASKALEELEQREARVADLARVEALTTEAEISARIAQNLEEKLVASASEFDEWKQHKNGDEARIGRIEKALGLAAGEWQRIPGELDHERHRAQEVPRRPTLGVDGNAGSEIDLDAQLGRPFNTQCQTNATREALQERRTQCLQHGEQKKKIFHVGDRIGRDDGGEEGVVVDFDVDGDPKIQKANGVTLVVPGDKFQKVKGSVFTEPGTDGDFKWMIENGVYPKGLYVFNDNTDDHFSARPGGGNALVRPFNRHGSKDQPAKSAGICTGYLWRGFECLSSEAKTIIDRDICEIRELLATCNYEHLIYSAVEGDIDLLGTGIFQVGLDVRSYIVKELKKFDGCSPSELQAERNHVHSAASCSSDRCSIASIEIPTLYPAAFLRDDDGKAPSSSRADSVSGSDGNSSSS